MTNDEANLEDLHQLRSVVFSRAKLWWGFGVVLGYLAIVAVPFAWLVGWQDWAGPLTAVVLAITGRISVWRSEGYREDAEWTLRTIELNSGIGYEVDAAKLADLRSKYFRALRRYGESVSPDDYYEASGDPSYALLMKMERESAWWTGQLAKRASKMVFAVMGFVALSSMSVIALGGLEVEGEVATTVTSEVLRRAYGLAICAIVLLDTFNLGVRYSRLSVAAGESMKRLNALLDEDDLCIPRVVTAVSDYQSARKEGPLIPDRFKRWHEKSLQSGWDKTFSVQERQG